MASSCAPSTSAKRVTSWRHWMRFLRESNYSIPPIRPSEIHICLWIVWLFKKKLAYLTVRTYLYALAAEIKYRGGRDILKKDFNWFIHSTMRHYQRSLGSAPIVYRRPLTVDILNVLLQSLNLSVYENRLYATMLSVGVYCLMRIGEICYSTSGSVDKFIRTKISNLDLIQLRSLYGTQRLMLIKKG